MIQSSRLQALLDKYIDQLASDITLEELEEFFEYHANTDSSEASDAPELDIDSLPDDMVEELLSLMQEQDDEDSDDNGNEDPSEDETEETKDEPEDGTNEEPDEKEDEPSSDSGDQDDEEPGDDSGDQDDEEPSDDADNENDKESGDGSDEETDRDEKDKEEDTGDEDDNSGAEEDTDDGDDENGLDEDPSETDEDTEDTTSDDDEEVEDTADSEDASKSGEDNTSEESDNPKDETDLAESHDEPADEKDETLVGFEENKENTPTYRPTKRQNKGAKIALIAIGVVILAVLLTFLIGILTYSFTAEKQEDTIYIFKDADAKTEIDFTNKSGSSKELTLSYDDDGTKREINQSIAGKKTTPVKITFDNVTGDKTYTLKYGFLNLKKVTVNVVAVEPYQIHMSNASIKISTEDSDITKKKYCSPNKKVTFTATISNSSKKAFEKDYEFKVNDKRIDTQTAKWEASDSTSNTATVKFTYTFEKQGYYKINIGNVKLNFICSTNDTPPENGAFLKKKVSGGSGQLKIENKYSFPVIVTLCKDTATTKALNRVYMKAKSTTTMSGIKDGSYIVYVKGGKGYSKMAKDILEPQAAYKSNSPMKFTTTSTTYSIWTLTLNVKGGNTNINAIDDNSIPM